MALTATATMQVRANIVKQLNLNNCKWFISSFDRPNLQYVVKPKSISMPINEIKEFIKTEYPQACGIIFVPTRKETKELATDLKKVKKHILSWKKVNDTTVRIIKK